MACGAESLCVIADGGGGGGGAAGGAGGGGGGGGVGGGDAGVDAGFDAGVDAGFDAGVPDAGNLDAGYCKGLSPAAFFCDDFDRGAIDPRWNVYAPNNVTRTISDGGWKSAPFSFLQRAPSGVTNPEATIDVTLDGGTTLSRRRVRADVFIQQLDPAGHRTVILKNVVGAEWVYLAVFDTGAELYEFRAGAPGQVALPPVPLNVWTTIELDLTVGSPTRVTVRYGGVAVLTNHAVGLTGGPQSPASAVLGMFINGTTTAETRVYADNFVYELLP
jgi:hypothetical protein